MDSLTLRVGELVHERCFGGQTVSIYNAYVCDAEHQTRVAAIWCNHPEGMWAFHTLEAADWETLDDEAFATTLNESQLWACRTVRDNSEA